MNTELADAIHLFRTDQESALAYLHGKLGIPVPSTGLEWAENGHEHVERVKSIADDDGVELYVHGFGIEVTHPDFHIDFDYGRDGQTDCFDRWRLSLHRHMRLGLPAPVDDPRPIKDWLDDAADAGELIRIDYATYYDPNSRSAWKPATHHCG
ncbi:DUF6896 domain-containing protein [Roseimaritima ulvae]|uniref:DUF6896 domain-containing protein n=1 Tax=Roseimaritima ulvae TaxID=980254 RepID=A0A5B9QMJ3_9BACT|nr:hypothetical protein [Roseimaritima ulvae]QEG40208.1 hypothetical protein UC8_22150 [Roseimaritima ulvae]